MNNFLRQSESLNMAGDLNKTLSSDEDKNELATKAKQKFLENLYKFQRKASRYSGSSFQRSCKGSPNKTNDLRRSYR